MNCAPFIAAFQKVSDIQKFSIADKGCHKVLSESIKKIVVPDGLVGVLDEIKGKVRELFFKPKKVKFGDTQMSKTEIYTEFALNLVMRKIQKDLTGWALYDYENDSFVGEFPTKYISKNKSGDMFKVVFVDGEFYYGVCPKGTYDCKDFVMFEK